MKPATILALSALLSGRSGIDIPPACVRREPEPEPEPRATSPADRERIAAAQAKRDRKAARLNAAARAASSGGS